MESKSHINLDLYNPSYVTVYAKQYDTNRIVNVTIMDNGKRVAANGHFITFQCATPSRKKYIAKSNDENTPIKVLDDGTIDITFAETILFTAGKVECEICFYNSEPLELTDEQRKQIEEGTLDITKDIQIEKKLITTMTFTIVVMPSVIRDYELTKAEEKTLTKLINDLAAVDLNSVRREIWSATAPQSGLNENDYWLELIGTVTPQ